MAVVTYPLSNELIDTWTSFTQARGGAPFCIRPLYRADRQREVAFIDSLSDRSRYFRFLAPLKFLPPDLLDQLMDIDYERRMAFVATIRRDGIETFISVARYVATDEAGTAEVSITVTDAWQRCGVGRLILRQLMRFARFRSIRRFTGVGLPDNEPMIRFARALGFDMHLDRAQHLMKIYLEPSDTAATLSPTRTPGGTGA